MQDIVSTWFMKKKEERELNIGARILKWPTEYVVVFLPEIVTKLNRRRLLCRSEWNGKKRTFALKHFYLKTSMKHLKCLVGH